MNQDETNKRVCCVCGGRGAVVRDTVLCWSDFRVVKCPMPCMNCTGGFVTAPSDADKSAPKETK